MNTRSALIAMSLLLAMTGCKNPINADLTGTPEEYVPPEIPVYDKVIQNPEPAAPAAKKTYKQTKDLLGQKAVPMDILFVVDTSDSMCSDQSKLAKNINSFVANFTKNDKIDFQIGVTVTWDSVTYGDAVRKFKNGELRPVVGQGENVRFVTPKTPNLQETLAKTLYVGFESFDKSKPETTGPEYEELFSPILAALSDEMLSGPNHGFRRPEAHLAVVLVTDTEDSTPDVMNPGQMMSAAYVAQELKSQVRGDATVTVLAALARYDEMNQYNAKQQPGYSTFAKKFPNPSLKACDKYSVDPALVPALAGPAKIASLVNSLKGQAFDLRTSDFGGKMASLGKTLLNKAMSFRVVLDYAPDVSEPIIVKINGHTISRNDKTGYSYNPDTNTIILNEGLDLGDHDKFQVEIDYTVL